MNVVKKRLFPEKEGAEPYISLVNLCVPIFFLLRETPTKLLVGFTLLLFLVIAFWLQYRHEKQALLWLAVQAVIILVFVLFYHPMYAYMVFMIAQMISRQKTSIILGTAAVMAVGIVIGLSQRLDTVTVWSSLHTLLLPPLFGVLVMPFIMRAAGQYKQMAERLQAATSQLERMAQQEERQRIARELHDTLGHTLSLITLKSEVTEKLITRNPERAIAEAREIQETSRAALKQMRQLVTEMKIVKLAEEYEHGRQLCAAAGIELEFQERSEGISPSAAAPSIVNRLPLSALQETILAMCFRETLTNVVRHSRAKHCSVRVEVEEAMVRLEISDDGIGIDEHQLKQSSGTGMAGLKQRLQLVDGTLAIESGTHKGTALSLVIPRVIRDGKGKGTS
ncbi:integral membrane sensor signal transduction histidine kinase [Paenibacillus alvei TS-15]|uniref:Oxygen sensor histidine kinase NreB n=1 Tax=Paenibacillus alvei TS-15 TaxID=1117108 RepID=S9U969_PAEAL|nr:sensor histidine kinase [Paenibacillus alvei]EPY07035.1 integral membrane sensor signal transduction histidine kinase [Paenibacillus alvei TS-15]